jgi:hypothetical protein
MANHGDIRRLTLQSQDQRVTTGSDFSRKPKWIKESVATSGAVDVKWTKQNEDIEGVEIQCSGAEREALIALTNEASLDAAYVTVHGDTYKSTVQIFITDDSTQDGKVTITIIPLSEWSASIV